MIRLPRTDYRFAALLQFFCTVAADNLPNRCTCFFAKVYAILILEKNRCSERSGSGSSVFAFSVPASIEIYGIWRSAAYGERYEPICSVTFRKLSADDSEDRAYALWASFRQGSYSTGNDRGHDIRKERNASRCGNAPRRTWNCTELQRPCGPVKSGNSQRGTRRLSGSASGTGSFASLCQPSKYARMRGHNRVLL